MKANMKTFCTRLKPELIDQLRLRKLETGRSIQQLVGKMIRKGLRKNK